MSFATALALTAVTGLPAHSITLFKFKGTVRDAAGRTMAAATVTDGSKTTTTAANGTYTLAEESTGRYTLRAYRSDTVTTTKTVDVTVPLDQTVDFTLLYRISGALSRSALSTASAPASTTLTVTSQAPSPGSPGDSGGKSCVYVTDSRTSEKQAATFVSTDPGTGISTWTYSLSVPQETREGAFSLNLTAEDCSSGLALTAPGQSALYIIDNTPPTTNPASLTPLDHGNAIFTTQVLSAEVRDFGGSGLDTASLTLRLIDETSGNSSTYSGAGLNYSAVSGWVKTAPVSLIPSHVYRLELSARDFAGNELNIGHDPVAANGGFLVTSLTLQATSGRIPTTPCTVAPLKVGATTRDVTCPNVPLVVDPSSVSMGASRHGDDAGYVNQRVLLASAYLKTTISGVEFRQAAYPAGDSRTVFQRFDVPEEFSSSTTFSMAGKTTNIGTLQTKVPATWNSATLEMPDTLSLPTTSACNDRTASSGTITCVPDPIVNSYVVLLNEDVPDATVVAAEHSAAYEAQTRSAEPGVPEYRAWVPFARINSLLADPRVAYGVRDATQDTFVTWGNSCETRGVWSRLNFATEMLEKQLVTAYSNDSTCNASVQIPVKLPGIAFEAALADPDCVPGTTKSNYLHTSHEIRGVEVTWTLGWLRTSYRRYWNVCRTVWSRVIGHTIAWSGSGPDWWQHWRPTFPYWDWSSQKTSVSGTTQAVFHGEPGLNWHYNCDITIRTIVKSYRGASSWYWDSAKIRACEGTHSQEAGTASTSQVNPYGAYGRTGELSQYPPAPPGGW